MNLLPNERLESFWDALWLGIRTFLCFKMSNWSHFGIDLGSLGGHFGGLVSDLRPLWSHFGPLRGHFKTVEGTFGILGSHFGALMGHLGAPWKPPWDNWGPLRGILAAL